MQKMLSYMYMGLKIVMLIHPCVLFKIHKGLCVQKPAKLQKTYKESLCSLFKSGVQQFKF